MKYETYKSNGKWFWRIKNSDGVIARSEKSYKSKNVAASCLSRLATSIAKDWNEPKGLHGCARGIIFEDWKR